MQTLKDLILTIASLASRRDDREMLMLLRRKLTILEREAPEVAKEVSRTISSRGGLGALRRFRDIDSVPVDSDSGLELLLYEENPMPEVVPVLLPETKETLNRFMRERRHISELRSAGIRPPSSLALMGPPGTGKTSLARWIAAELNSPMMILNLASVVTSYLGQTGQNIKKALDRAKLEPSVLLLDEFDALGRLRTDNDDVGEMKRVVTVLLQEVERWPDHSVLIAATNLPELVDPAFRRRFSRWVWLSLPGQTERLQILQSHYTGRTIPERHMKLAATCLVGLSGADLASFANRVVTRQVLDHVSPIESVWEELVDEVAEKELSVDDKKSFIQLARKVDAKRFTFRKLGQLLGISHTTAAQLAKASINRNRR